jgi:hypothetical protein
MTQVTRANPGDHKDMACSLLFLHPGPELSKKVIEERKGN